jgi:hypothetical protein
VEVDEVYIGGKPRIRGTYRNRIQHKEKSIVMGMVERGGDVRFRLMDRLTSERIGEVLAENADLTCRVIFDCLRRASSGHSSSSAVGPEWPTQPRQGRRRSRGCGTFPPSTAQ